MRSHQIKQMCEEEPYKKRETSGLERELASGSISLIRPGMFKGYGAAAKAAPSRATN
jgi:hypothetical protein